MSNAAGAQASREEEIAFLAMEAVLGVEIKLADAGAGNKMPDGTWVYPDGRHRHGIVEITSPPAKSLMSEWAAAKREGRAQSESGSVPTRFGELAQVCSEMLTEDWARENLDKLLEQPSDERHLSCLRGGTTSVTTSTDSPIRTTTRRWSTWRTSCSRKGSRTSGSVAEHRETLRHDWAPRGSGLQGSKPGPGGTATW